MSSAPNAATCPSGGGVIRKRAVLVNSDIQTAPIDGSLDAFCRTVLKAIAELSPCSEDRLFLVAATRELGGEQSLGNLKKRLRAGLLQLIDKGAVEIQGEELVVTARGKSALEADAQAELAAEPIHDAEETEIVASIRRVITDDEANNSKVQSASSQGKAKGESLEEREDTQITDDIARVLSGRGAEAPEKDMEEEILDLAGELGGVEIVEDDINPAAEVAESAEDVELLNLDEVVDPPKARAAPRRPPKTYQSQHETHSQANVPERTKAIERSAALKRAVAALRAERLTTHNRPLAEPLQTHRAGQPDVMKTSEPAAELPPQLEGDVPSGSSHEPPRDVLAHLATETSVRETEGAKHNEPSPKFTWPGPKVEEQSGSLLGYLAENIPRRMRAHKTVEAEVRIAPIISQELVSNLVGQSRVKTHEVEIAQAMSLRLSAPMGGF